MKLPGKQTLNTWFLIGIVAVVLLIATAGAANYLLGPRLSMGGDFLSGTQLTVYNQGLGLVKQRFQYELPAGTSHLLLEGVASEIDTASVKLSDAGNEVSLLEQNYQYDLVSMDKLMERFLGEEVRVLLKDPREEVTGTLLSYSGGRAIIETENEVQILESGEYILPGMETTELLLKPTLDWLVSAPSAATYDMELLYMTRGISWEADYILHLNDADTEAGFKGWVTIDNNAGTTFENAELKLVAGDVRVEQEYPTPRYNIAYEDAVMAGAKGFEEESFFEYHLYTLDRPTTVRDNEQKQVSLLEAADIGVEKRFVYDGGEKVDVKVLFNNEEGNGMGMPLPKGKVKVFKEDSSGALQFVGEDRMDHTPKDEEVELVIGSAFDIVAEKKQMDYDRGTTYNTYTYEIELRNHKEEAVTIRVEEPAYGWRDWEIVRENFEHEKESQQKVIWNIPVPADGSETLEYTIRYRR